MKKNVYNRNHRVFAAAKKEDFMEVILAGGLFVIIIAVIIAVVASVVSAVAADQDVED